ncbi:MAG: FHA domain-containing protein [Phototrophicaceae bacterium]
MKCKDCGYENRAGILICDNCGSDIYDILVGEAQTKQLDRDSKRDLQLSEPPSSRPLMLYIADGSAPLSIERKNSLIIGRADPAKTHDTDVQIDLTSFNAQHFGVSRKHAQLDAREQPPVLVDLGSYNGTYINGERLTKDIPKILESGDEIQMGRLKMRLYYK